MLIMDKEVQICKILKFVILVVLITGRRPTEYHANGIGLLQSTQINITSRES